MITFFLCRNSPHQFLLSVVIKTILISPPSPPPSLSLYLWQSGSCLSTIARPAICPLDSLLPCRCSPSGGGIRAPGVWRHCLPLQQHSPHALASRLPVPDVAPSWQRAGWCGLWEWEVPGRQPRGGCSEYHYVILMSATLRHLSIPRGEISFFITFLLPLYLRSSPLWNTTGFQQSVMCSSVVRHSQQISCSKDGKQWILGGWITLLHVLCCYWGHFRPVWWWRAS